MDIPSESDLAKARVVIEEVIEFTKQTEPYATNFINAGEELLLGWPDILTVGK